MRSLIKWLPKAHTIDTLDSPHLCTFIKEIVWKKLESLSRLASIEKHREGLLQSKESIAMIDFGAGSFRGAQEERKIAEIARNAVSNQSKCELLYKLVQHFEPQSILELGTSLGISSLYLQAAAPDATLTTIEGDLQILGIAATHSFDWANNVEYINASFEQGLNQLVTAERMVDLILIDGAHHSSLQSVLTPYYKSISTKSTVWIVDDIYWSKDMTDWWQTLKRDKTFNVAIDMYHFGILYYEEGIKEALDVKINPLKIRWKPGLIRPPQ